MALRHGTYIMGDTAFGLEIITDLRKGYTFIFLTMFIKMHLCLHKRSMMMIPSGGRIHCLYGIDKRLAQVFFHLRKKH